MGKNSLQRKQNVLNLDNHQGSGMRVSFIILIINSIRAEMSFSLHLNC